jgi:hypothetical protein
METIYNIIESKSISGIIYRENFKISARGNFTIFNEG